MKENIQNQEKFIVSGEVEAKVSYTDSKREYLLQEILTNTGEEENKFQIKFNNFQINFYKTLSKFKICDTIYTEQNLKIFSNFYLPISVVKITNKEQIKEQRNYTESEAKNLAVQELAEKIESRIENKENILRKYSKCNSGGKLYRCISDL